jgi:lysyl endopeptidase
MKFTCLLTLLSLSAGAFAGQSYFPALDVNKMHDLELQREKKGEAPRFAVARPLSINVAESTDWTQQGDLMVWQHEVTATNAVSLNFGFREFNLPEGASVEIQSPDFRQRIRPFTSADNNAARELWTPVLMSDSAVIEVRVPASRFNELSLTLTQVGQGFRTFAQQTKKAGKCNIDVACKEGAGWEQEINSVAVLSSNGTTFCTGFMVNNTAGDRTPYFMTADHCGVTARKAPSLVTYWNYQTEQCGGARNGKLTQFTTGAEFLAGSTKSDFTLLKLNQLPNREWGVTYAGWDRSGVDASEAVAIHHPSTDEKSISFEFDPTTITSYLGDDVPGDNTHVRVEDWDKGTTEPGSSGSPLFNQDHRVIGQLHGGWASCTSQTADYYGRIYTSWEGEGRSGTRLKDFLDARNTGAMTTDTLQ